MLALDFTTLYTDPKIKKLLFKASAKYSSILDHDDRVEAAQNALFYAIRKFKSGKNTQFTSYLYNCVIWQCKKIACEKYDYNVRNRSLASVDENCAIYYDTSKLNVLLNCLSEDERILLLDKFINNKTYAELGKVHNVSGELIRQRISAIIIKIRTMNPETTPRDILE